MNSGLNVLSFKDKSIGQLLDDASKQKKENDVARMVFGDNPIGLSLLKHSINSSGAIQWVQEFYENNKKYLKNLRAVENSLREDALENPELIEQIDEALYEGRLWTTFYMKTSIFDLMDKMKEDGLDIFSDNSAFKLEKELNRLEASVNDYVWSDEIFVTFMYESINLYPDIAKSPESMMLHMLSHGPSIVVQQLLREQHEKEIGDITKKSAALQAKSERKINKLTDDVQKQKEMVSKLQNKLNKKSSKNISESSQKTDMQKIKIEYEKQFSVLDAGFNHERKALLRQIEALKIKNASLTDELINYKELLREDIISEPVKEPLDLNQYNIIFMGGHQNLVNKLSDLYPNWTFYNDDTLNAALPKDADFLVYFTNHCSHTLFNSMQSWNKMKKRPIHYAYSNNIEQLVQSVQEFIYEEDNIPKHKKHIKKSVDDLIAKASTDKENQAHKKHTASITCKEH